MAGFEDEAQLINTHVKSNTKKVLHGLSMCIVSKINFYYDTYKLI